LKPRLFGKDVIVGGNKLVMSWDNLHLFYSDENATLFGKDSTSYLFTKRSWMFIKHVFTASSIKNVTCGQKHTFGKNINEPKQL